jgi:transcriptional regulator with XRE-family HTH domain
MDDLPQETQQTLRERLRQQRKRQGLSQSQLAEIVYGNKQAQSRISDLETGEGKSFTLVELYSFVRRLGPNFCTLGVDGKLVGPEFSKLRIDVEIPGATARKTIRRDQLPAYLTPPT